MEDSIFYTKQELADYLGVSNNWISRYLAIGRIPGMVRVGKLIRFKRDDIKEQMKSGQVLLPPTKGSE